MGAGRTSPTSEIHPGVENIADRQADGTRALTPDDFRIRVEPADNPDSIALIEASQASLLNYMPADEIFSLDPAEMSAPNISLLVARLDGKAVGCVALVDMTSYGEVKRLFVTQEGRGRGVGRALMVELENLCRDIGLVEIKMETSPVLFEAVALYRSMGYADCAPFGGYPVIESSLFMSRKIGSI